MLADRRGGHGLFIMMIAFSTVDWWIVGIYVLLATIPGFLCRKYVLGQADFLIAGRTLSIFLATATLTATEMGLITVMYMAEFGYVNGFSGMVLGVIAMASTLFIGLTGFMVTGLRASGATTVAEYYEMRFSRGVRVVGGAIIAAAGILNYGVFLRIEADFVRIVTQIPDFEVRAVMSGAEPIEISSVKLVMSVLLAIVLLYTLLGGMVSVVVTDYVQFIILTLGMAGATYWVLTGSGVGGLDGMMAAVREYRPDYGLNPFATKGALGVGLLWILWQCMHWLGTNTWQTQAFRTAASDSPETARKMWILTSCNYFGRAIIPMIWGIAALAYLGADPPGGDSKIAMPVFLSRLPTGLVGFLMAGMLAALMSTHSSYLLAWSGVLTEDLLSPLIRFLTGRELPQGGRIWVTRCFIVLLGLFLLMFGLFFEVEGTIWGYLAVTGTMYVAGAMTLVAMGLYWKRANTTGAYCGLLGGAVPGAIYLILRIGALIVEPAIKEAGHEATTTIAKLSDQLTDPVVGVISFPLAAIGMILGSMWGRRQGAGVPATLPRPEPALETSATGGEA